MSIQITADAIDRVTSALTNHLATLHAEREALASGDFDAVAEHAERKRHDVIAVQGARGVLARAFEAVTQDVSAAAWVAAQDELLQSAYADLLGKTRLAQELTQANGRMLALLIHATQSRLAVLQGARTQTTYSRTGYGAGGLGSYSALESAA